MRKEWLNEIFTCLHVIEKLGWIVNLPRPTPFAEIEMILFIQVAVITQLVFNYTHWNESVEIISKIIKPDSDASHCPPQRYISMNIEPCSYMISILIIISKLRLYNFPKYTWNHDSSGFIWNAWKTWILSSTWDAWKHE